MDQLLLNGVPQKVDWDGKRLQLPSIKIGAKIIEVHFTAEVTNRGVGIHHYHDPKNQQIITIQIYVLMTRVVYSLALINRT